MNRLDSNTRIQVINCLIEGCSIRATVRMTGVAKKTVMRLLCEVGEFCADYQDKMFQNLPCKRLQLEEIWSWIYCKAKNRTEEIAKKNPAAGDVWLWTAVCADTKLVACWRLGARNSATALRFVVDLSAVALNFFAYNYIKIHRTLRVTPAMAAKVTDRLWEVKDLVAMWQEYEKAKAA
jgi:IS1 family transposase